MCYPTNLLHKQNVKLWTGRKVMYCFAITWLVSEINKQKRTKPGASISSWYMYHHQNDTSFCSQPFHQCCQWGRHLSLFFNSWGRKRGYQQKQNHQTKTTQIIFSLKILRKKCIKKLLWRVTLIFWDCKQIIHFLNGTICQTLGWGHQMKQ